MAYRVPLPPPPQIFLTELEAIAIGAPGPEDFAAWLDDPSGRTLWEYVVDVRRHTRPLPRSNVEFAA